VPTYIVICNWYLAPVGDQVAAIRARSVSMAMGVLMKPRLLILNEPTTGLDRYALLFHLFWKLSFAIVIDLQHKIYIYSASTLQGLMRDAGRTIIASSHQLRCEIFILFDYHYFLSWGNSKFGKFFESCDVTI
jgi:energy-coupling factor transporter ATP-binding protein EcfA2